MPSRISPPRTSLSSGIVGPHILSRAVVTATIGRPRTFAAFAQALGVPAPEVSNDSLEPTDGVLWCPKTPEPPFVAKLCVAKSERRRHLRKYAEGELGPDRSFYFRGPENKLNLKAHNLQVFTTMAQGVDDETWLFHLRQGEYSLWFREAIKDPELADEVAAVERDHASDPGDSRKKIIEAIERRYTAAA